MHCSPKKSRNFSKKFPGVPNEFSVGGRQGKPDEVFFDPRLSNDSEKMKPVRKRSRFLYLSGKSNFAFGAEKTDRSERNSDVVRTDFIRNRNSAECLIPSKKSSRDGALILWPRTGVDFDEKRKNRSFGGGTSHCVARKTACKSRGRKRAWRGKTVTPRTLGKIRRDRSVCRLTKSGGGIVSGKCTVCFAQFFRGNFLTVADETCRALGGRSVLEGVSHEVAGRFFHLIKV